MRHQFVLVALLWAVLAAPGWLRGQAVDEDAVPDDYAPHEEYGDEFEGAEEFQNDEFLPDDGHAGAAYHPRRFRAYAPPPQGSGIIDGLFRRDRFRDDECCEENCCPPYFQHRTQLFGELLFLRPRDAEVAYAVPVNGPVTPVLGNGIQIGPAAVADPDYDAGFRVGFHYAIDCKASLSGTFWSFSSTTEDSADIIAPDVIRSLVTHPLGANAATDVLSASATLDVDFDIADADYRAILVCTDCYVVNYLLGARYGHLSQDFHGEFTRTGTTVVDTNIDFDGGGIRLGLEGERTLSRRGWLVYARTTANFVGGEFRARYTQNDSFQQTVVDTEWRSGRVVPILDMELGLGWIGPCGRWKFSAGYMVSAWYNAVKTDDFINAVQTNDFRNLGDTLTFDGLTARVVFRF